MFFVCLFVFVFVCVLPSSRSPDDDGDGKDVSEFAFPEVRELVINEADAMTYDAFPEGDNLVRAKRQRESGGGPALLLYKRTQ